jgi:TPR repeat protein
MWKFLANLISLNSVLAERARAVEAGHEGAGSVLGMGYVTGKRGFPIDIELGTQLLEKAASAGDEQSAAMLQMMCDKKGLFAKKRR